MVHLPVLFQMIWAMGTTTKTDHKIAYDEKRTFCDVPIIREYGLLSAGNVGDMFYIRASDC